MFWFQQTRLQTTLSLFVGYTILTLNGTKAYEETSIDEKSVVYSHSNEIPNTFVVDVKECQEGFLRCICYPGFIKNHIMLGLLQTLALVQLQNFQKYLPLASLPSKLKS